MKKIPYIKSKQEYKPYYWWLNNISSAFLTEEEVDFTLKEIEIIRHIVYRTWKWGKEEEILTNSSFIKGHKRIKEGEQDYWFIRPVKMGQTALRETLKNLEKKGIVKITPINSKSELRKFSLAKRYIDMVEKRKDRTSEINKLLSKSNTKGGKTTRNRVKINTACKESDTGSESEPLNSTLSTIDIDQKNSKEFLDPTHIKREPAVSFGLKNKRENSISRISIRGSSRTRVRATSCLEENQNQNQDSLQERKETSLEEVIESSIKESKNTLVEKTEGINSNPTLKNVQAQWALSILNSEEYKNIPIEKISRKEISIFRNNYKANPTSIALSKIIDRAVQEWGSEVATSYLGKNIPSTPSFRFFAYSYKYFLRMEYEISEINYKKIVTIGSGGGDRKINELEQEILLLKQDIEDLQRKVDTTTTTVDQEINSRLDTLLETLYTAMDNESRPEVDLSHRYARGEIAPPLPTDIDWNDDSYDKSEKEYQRKKQLDIKFKKIIDEVFMSMKDE